MQNFWQKTKQELIKTFVRGDKIPAYSGFITWRTHNPSRLEIWWSRTKYQIKENAVVIQTVATVLGVIVAGVSVVVSLLK